MTGSVIVADASPLIALHDGNCIGLLHLAYDEVVIPHEVYREVYQNINNRAKPRWIKVKTLEGETALRRIEILRNKYFLDAGESEAIALSEQMNVHVLIDERAARDICLEIGVPHVSAFEILVRLGSERKISKKQLDAGKEAIRLHGGFTPDPDSAKAAI